MRVSTEKKEHEVKIVRGDLAAEKMHAGEWSDLKGKAYKGICVSHNDKKWLLMSNVNKVEDREPGHSTLWKETFFEVGVFYGVPLDPVEESKLTEDHTKPEVVAGHILPKTDYPELKIAKIQKVITGWDLVNEKTGEPVPCTDENKKIVYLCNPELIDEVMMKFNKFGKTAGIDRTKAELGN